MKKTVFTIALVAAGFFACVPAAPDAHNSRNSLDWEGLYAGTLPGANSAIEVRITLNSDNTYIVTNKYVDKSDEVYTYSGSFIWDKAGGMITLDDEVIAPYYRVGEGKLTQLDMYKKEITGQMSEMYVLQKVTD